MEQQQEQVQAGNGIHKTTTYWDPERDRPRGLNMVRLEVVNRKTAGLQLPRGWVLYPGISVIEVYPDEVALVEAQVEKRQDQLEQAQLSYRLSIAEDAKGRVSGYGGDAEEFLKRVDAREPAYVAEYEFVRARTSDSPEAQFRQIMKRDPFPLDSVKVLDRNIPEPKRSAVKLIEAENSKGRSEIGAAIADGIAEAQKPLLTAMAEQNKVLSQLLAKLSK